MKEFEKLKYEIDLISKGEHNQEFTGVYQRLTELTQALQLQQTGVMRSACKHDEKNDTKAYAKNGNEFIGYYCEKCDTVYCGSI
jgi:hypothetical protein